MGLILALKAFFTALKDPKKAELFISGKAKETPMTEFSENSHLRLLAMMQQSSRLIDFLKEDISGFDDEQVGATVRKIHADCGKCLEDIITIRPLFEQNEGMKIDVPKGYDPMKIKVVGRVKGEPPYTGILIHRGWKAHKKSLPKKSGELSNEVICPAEVEIR